MLEVPFVAVNGCYLSDGGVPPVTSYSPARILERTSAEDMAPDERRGLVRSIRCDNAPTHSHEACETEEKRQAPR